MPASPRASTVFGLRAKCLLKSTRAKGVIMDIGFIGLGKMGFPMARRVIEGKRVRRFVDLSTVGSHMAARIHDLLAKRNIVQLDSPVSGGVGGAEKGTLAVMVSGPKAEFELIKPALEVIGKVFFIGEKPGSAQTM